jgi:cytochrome c oxidase subunit 4
MSAQEHHGHHIATAQMLWAVGIGLVILTILTVVVSTLGLPSPLDILAALTIAIFKAYLVAAYFMGLKWDNKFNSILLIGALAFFILMVSITLLDTMYRIEVVPSF